ncbi:tail assembly chaperone [Photorhabdus khanii subsp. guanajuatensis]|uniref:Tail assembly chaperone n=1 Tax=Photorhabdus khanii subsp. guanajuatensis TaxID=2100166 RepID=A0A4R4JS27_9GAMM|nr:tail assembly chaperone [Photorhabdus khanii subsp. guanajuatensis]
MLHFAFVLAEQLGEIDPYKILSLPVSTLNEWQAYYRLKNRRDERHDTYQPATATPISCGTIQEQCDAVVKLLS